MAQPNKAKKSKFGIRGFLILVVIAVIGGIALKTSGYLVSPFEYSGLMLTMQRPEQDSNFQMVTIDDETGELVTDESESSAQNTGFQMVTIDETTGELATDESDATTEDAGFQMVTIDDETGELSETTPSEFPERGEMPAYEVTLASYFDLSWDDIGSVLYDVWFILVCTIAVIVIARPIGWIVKRVRKQPVRQAHVQAVS